MGIFGLIRDSLFDFSPRGAKTTAKNDQRPCEINPHQQRDHTAKCPIQVVKVCHFPCVKNEKLLNASKRESDEHGLDPYLSNSSSPARRNFVKQHECVKQQQWRKEPSGKAEQSVSKAKVETEPIGMIAIVMLDTVQNGGSDNPD